MDMESFESRKKQLRIQKYLDTCGRGLTRKFHVVVVQNNSKKNVQKCVLHVQSCFFFFSQLETYCLFVLPFSLPSTFSIRH